MTNNLGDILNDAINPDATAIFTPDGSGSGRRYSYRELDELSSGVARSLTASGHKRSSRIAISSLNHAEYLATVFGAQRAGMVVVPVNFKFPRATVEYILADSGAEVFFVDSGRADTCPEGFPKVVYGDEGVEGFDAFVDPGAFETIEAEPKEAAEVLYTSGSTGIPKGVVLSHASHLWVLHTRLRNLSLLGEGVLVAAPLYHMQGLTMSQLTLAGGGALILLPRFHAATYIAAIDRARPTWITGVPPMIAMMLQERALMEAADLSCVTTIRLGSAPVSEQLLRGISEFFPHASVVNGYGTTETGPVAFGPHPQRISSPVGSVGYPHPEVELRLSSEGFDDDNTGILEIRSPGAMTEYLNRPELMVTFTSDNYYRTGDIFRRDGEGFYYFVGRSDDMFVSGGENIFPSEVEKAIESLPGVSQACVVATADEVKGHKPAAFVVAEPGQKMSEKAVQQHVLEVAPAYQYPRHVWFLPSIPLTSTNKPDRNRLLELAEELLRAGSEQPGAPGTS